ncbi:putative ubiquitin carboxyl-terminal hydrolase K02C4.3 [Toxocara canis]|uniref:Putative ubiquitin carboxyl-terminal hydrolase K02C4.3 n=1 Tax=Toxocara canis TaxID=6265 RepID=A0A0B2VYM2_TOXCA|nr:putative ubiquitin carboxyl-terminal hydrolase K02C4.3 [Toxocara canis]
MTVLSVPGGKGRGPVEGEGPERAASTLNNVGPMTAQETMFFNRVKDWLGAGVNERVLMQVVKSHSVLTMCSAQSESAMNDVVVAYLDRLQAETKGGRQVRFNEVPEKCSFTPRYSKGTVTERSTEMIDICQDESKQSTKYNTFPTSSLENKEEQDMIKAIEESLKENQNIPGFSPIAQSDPDNPHERSRCDLSPVGLKNMGNSCWFNVISQTLFHIAQFRQLLLDVNTANLSTRGSNPWTSEPSSSNEPSVTPQTLLLTLRRLFASLMASGRGYVDPSDVLSTISELNSTLNKAVPSIGIQQDATEMLLRLIEWLEQALKKYANIRNGNVSPPAPVEQDEAMSSVNDENADPNVLASTQRVHETAASSEEMMVDDPLARSSSTSPPAEQLPFNALFHGSHIEIRLSADGSTTSSKLDNSMQMVNLDVSFDNLHDSLEAYHFADAPSKEASVWFESVPAVIIFSLVRFSYKNGQTEKLHNKFHFPIEFFMDRYMHRNRNIVIEKKRHRAMLKEKLDIVKAQLDRMQNYPVGSVTASIPEIINATISLKPAYVDNNCTNGSGLDNDVHQPMDVGGNESSGCAHSSSENMDSEGNVVLPQSQRTKISLPADADLDALLRLLESIGAQFQNNINGTEGYRLHSVIIHEGEANVGHYWAYIADHLTLNESGSPTAWRKFNDKAVEPATWSQIEEDSFGSRRTCSAYCLVYTRKKSEEELFQRDSTVSLKTLSDLVNSLPEDLKTDVSLDNDAFTAEMTEWDKQHATPPPCQISRPRPIFDKEVMSSFSHKTPLNVEELARKYDTQAYRYFGALIIKKSMEKVGVGISESQFWEDGTNASRLVDDAVKNYTSVVDAVFTEGNESENLDGHLLLSEWLRMCSIPLSVISRIVYVVRVLMCSEKIQVRAASAAKLRAIEGTMKPTSYEAISNELDDAHILYEIFWQAVAVLADIIRKLQKEVTIDLKQLAPQTKLLCVAVRMLDKIVPYMKDRSVETRDKGLFALLLDYLLIYYAIKITHGLLEPILRESSEQKFDDNAMFLSREYKALILRIRSMDCEASKKALDFILKVWAQTASNSRELFKVASFNQMLIEASNQEAPVEMPAVGVNVTVKELGPDLFSIRSFMQRIGLYSRGDLLSATNVILDQFLVPYLKAVVSDS